MNLKIFFSIKQAAAALFLCVTFIFSAAIPSYSSEDDQQADKNWAVTFYPALSATTAFYTALIGEKEFFTAGISGEVEYKLNGYFSIPVELRYLYIKHDEISVNIADVAPGIRLYPFGEGMRGLFIGHYVQFIYGRIDGVDNIDDLDKSQYIGLPDYYIATTWFGYRWVFTNMHFELSLGATTYNPIKNRDADTVTAVGFFGIGFGITF